MVLDDEQSFGESMIDIILKTAVEAGAAILDVYDRDFKVEFKADESPLTAADMASHNIIVQALASTPYPVLSEESAHVPYEERSRWDTYWLVDPLDGTKEFIKKNGEFTVNIALVENGIPVLGVVYAPAMQILYYGSQAEGMEQGAWRVENCEGKSVDEIFSAASSCAVPHPPCTSPLRVVASKSHCNDETLEFIAALESEYGTVERVSRGSSLKLCMVAEGSAGIYPRIAPTMEWDTAAAHAVVVAAGGRVLEYDKNLPVDAYIREKRDTEGRSAPTASDLPQSARPALRPLRYNKKNLLNPYFVVCG
jgi:3'(2'), 5'-bisphosphate nucleotidase